MTMKRRIFISNTAMVLISLLILFGTFGCIFGLFEKEHMDGMEQEDRLSDYIYEVQTILLEKQNFLGTWEELSREVGDFGFLLYVVDGDADICFSNIQPEQEENISELDKTEFMPDRVSVYHIDGLTVAGCMIMDHGASYYVYALSYAPERLNWSAERGMFEMFIIVFLITGLLAIAGLLLCSQAFTKMLIKKIMKPVEELSLAAKRINNGDLNTPIVYCEKDEFEEVCCIFNIMQEHLREGIEKNEMYEKARTEMVAGISHDLRTPLTSVKAFIKGILDGVANTPEKQRQYLSIAYQKACDMETLLQKLFFFSRVETGNLPFYMQQVEMGQWIRKYVSDREMEIQEKNGSISVEGEMQETLVNIDVEQMKRVFDNLVENSFKYANVTNLEITISMKRKVDRLAVLFCDNGQGLDADKIPHVFEQFYRGDESRNSKTEGSGLGLYVCKYIVEGHAGKISAKDQETGFAVEIELPMGAGGNEDGKNTYY